MKLLKIILCAFIATQSAQAMECSTCCLGAFAVTGVGAYLMGLYHNNDKLHKKGFEQGVAEGRTQGATAMFRHHETKIMTYDQLKSENAALAYELRQRRSSPATTPDMLKTFDATIARKRTAMNSIKEKMLTSTATQTNRRKTA